jgi:hypothetical protein
MVGTSDVGGIVFPSFVEFVVAENFWSWPSQPAFKSFEHTACREKKYVYVVADGVGAEQSELIQPRLIQYFSPEVLR